MDIAGEAWVVDGFAGAEGSGVEETIMALNDDGEAA
jgi:hypothetical protein